ncbi:hypothetical protein KUTeg_024503 [Tegillarca granosa]|uniref:Uncharacterized protein n=1 Tax=Tegillarca granosa TaxID=220873 RepID=A0ABQ9E315_TEGGR|nr:hypothetical protein KUTeg_024503 [Tegillarca granosa]
MNWQDCMVSTANIGKVTETFSVVESQIDFLQRQQFYRIRDMKLSVSLKQISEISEKKN